MGVSKKRGKKPKMDGENNGSKPLFFNGWFGEFYPYFWFNTHIVCFFLAAVVCSSERFEFPYPNGDLEPVGLTGPTMGCHMCNSHRLRTSWFFTWRKERKSQNANYIENFCWCFWCLSSLFVVEGGCHESSRETTFPLTFQDHEAVGNSSEPNLPVFGVLLV